MVRGQSHFRTDAGGVRFPSSRRLFALTVWSEAHFPAASLNVVLGAVVEEKEAAATATPPISTPAASRGNIRPSLRANGLGRSHVSVQSSLSGATTTAAKAATQAAAEERGKLPITPLQNS